MATSGGCLCKSVRFSVTGAPLAARVCWCRVCQYLGAGNGAMSVCFRADAVSVQGEVKWFESIADSGNRMQRGFCPTCGTQLFSKAESRPHLTFIRAGALDNPNLMKPQMTIWTDAAPSLGLHRSGPAQGARPAAACCVRPTHSSRNSSPHQRRKFIGSLFKMLKTLFAASTLTLAAACLTPALADDGKLVRSISLSGHGEVRMAPDLAIVTVGVMSSAATAREALDANTKAMEGVMASLTAAGIEARDIQTSNFSVNPRYDYGQNNAQPPKVVGYDVSNNVSVTVRKLDSLGAVLDQVVSSGSNQINGVAFQVSKPEAATDEARKLAVADALHKAQIYTAASGVTLGQIISLTEGGGYQPPQPVFKSMRAESASADVPIAQGEQVIAVDVNFTWEIK